MASDEDWFLPKRYGYGAGLPIRWQGWALIGGFLAAIGAASPLVPRHPLLFAALALIGGVGVSIVSAHHTRGGWRWRWGGDT